MFQKAKNLSGRDVKRGRGLGGRAIEFRLKINEHPPLGNLC